MPHEICNRCRREASCHTPAKQFTPISSTTESTPFCDDGTNPLSNSGDYVEVWCICHLTAIYTFKSQYGSRHQYDLYISSVLQTTRMLGFHITAMRTSGERELAQTPHSHRQTRVDCNPKAENTQKYHRWCPPVLTRFFFNMYKELGTATKHT